MGKIKYPLINNELTSFVFRSNENKTICFRNFLTFSSSLTKLDLLLLIEFAKITLLAALLDPFHYSVEQGNCQNAIERNLLPIIAFRPLLRLESERGDSNSKFWLRNIRSVMPEKCGILICFAMHHVSLYSVTIADGELAWVLRVLQYPQNLKIGYQYP